MSLTGCMAAKYWRGGPQHFVEPVSTYVSNCRVYVHVVELPLDGHLTGKPGQANILQLIWVSLGFEPQERSAPVVPAMVASSQGSMNTTRPSLVLGTIMPRCSGE